MVRKQAVDETVLRRNLIRKACNSLMTIDPVFYEPKAKSLVTVILNLIGDGNIDECQRIVNDLSTVPFQINGDFMNEKLKRQQKDELEYEDIF